MKVHSIFRILLFAALAALMTAPLAAAATNPGDPPPNASCLPIPDPEEPEVPVEP